MGEFADKLLTWFLKTFYDAFYGIVEKSLQGLFDTLNNQFSSASRLITKGPRLWNGSCLWDSSGGSGEYLYSDRRGLYHGDLLLGADPSGAGE